ncbi:MAG: tetratricopeptide repeat protein [Actinomycetaceae bacterium]|nr:tetratricopeptide repeat protein [Actinomycetaceae bacterium]
MYSLEEYFKTINFTGDDKLTVNNAFGLAFYETGKLDKAIELFEENYQTLCKELWETHPNTLISRTNLARAYQDAGRLEEAKQLLERD